MIYAPEYPSDRDPLLGCSHGNFFDAAYAAILARPQWAKRFNKVHTQSRSLPKWAEDPRRKWRELDSCMSSDALLMNVFCTPGVADRGAVRRMLGVHGDALLEFGWKARVPFTSGLLDRTEVDLRWGDLLIEAKLTETDFQTRAAPLVEAYRDFAEVFDPDLLPRTLLRKKRKREAIEYAEEFTQEWEDTGDVDADEASAISRAYQAELAARGERPEHFEAAYAGYQLIRNVLAAQALGYRFCVIADERRPDLREAWFRVMAAVRNSGLRTRLMAVTWQELAACLPEDLQDFLDRKYGIVAPGRAGTPLKNASE